MTNLERKSEIAQLCLTLCSPMDCSLPGSSVKGIFQARELEWVAIFFSRGSFWPRDWTWVSRIAGRCFTIWATREAPNLGSMLKSRDLHLLRKVHIVKPMVFSSSQVWIWELDHKEGWGPKNRCFWIMVWRRLLRVPWTARRSNQSILKEINPEYSLKGLMLKFQYFSQNRFKETAHWTRPWAGKEWKARGEGGNRGWDG